MPPTAPRRHTRARFLQRLPGSGRVCCRYSWHPPARSPGSEQPDWHCSVLQRGKKEFSPLQEPYHPLTPPRQPAALQDTSKHPDGKAHQDSLLFFFFNFFSALGFFFPFLIALLLDPLKQSRGGAAFLCLIGNMCVRFPWRQRAWRGTGLPAWSCRGRRLRHGDDGTAPAALTWATEPAGGIPSESGCW